MNKSIESMNKSIESMNINRPNQICLLLPLNGSFETNGLPYRKGLRDETSRLACGRAHKAVGVDRRYSTGMTIDYIDSVPV